MPTESEKLHPILDAMTTTITGLHEHKKDEAIRKKLLELEKLLHESLEEPEDKNSRRY